MYPGHGSPTDTSVFAAGRAYIADLLEVAASATTDEEARAEMVRRYPGYANVDFLLAMSVAHQRALAATR